MNSAGTLEKRTSESILYSINCAMILDAGEVITSISSVTADSSGLVFGTPAINALPINYDDGSIAPIGTVITVRISAGVIITGTSQTYTIRAKFATSAGNSREATVLLLVSDVAS